MKSLILYSTIVGGFFAQSEALDQVIAIARQEAGDDVWKRGFSGNDKNGATAFANYHLHNAGIKPVSIEGHIGHVGFVQNRDHSGNSYPKLRLGISNSQGDEFMLSLDLKGDVAQRLLVKLDNCFPDQFVKVSAWPTIVERGDRKFINHAASMKDAVGKEVPANTSFSAGVKTECDKVEKALLEIGVDDKRVINTAKVNKRVECHKQLLLKIQSAFISNSVTA